MAAVGCACEEVCFFGDERQLTQDRRRPTKSISTQCSAPAAGGGVAGGLLHKGLDLGQLCGALVALVSVGGLDGRQVDDRAQGLRGCGT